MPARAATRLPCPPPPSPAGESPPRPRLPSRSKALVARAGGSIWSASAAANRIHGSWRHAMKRVASLYLPDWSIDRLRRAAHTAAPPEAAPPPRFVDMKTAPRDGGRRPGARWGVASSSPERGGRLGFGLPPAGQDPVRATGSRPNAPASSAGGGGAWSTVPAPRAPSPSTIRQKMANGPPPRSGEDLKELLVTSIREGSKVL